MENGKMMKKMIKKWFSKEISLDSILFIARDSRVLVDSQWSQGFISPWYLTLRVFLFLLMIAFIALDITMETTYIYEGRTEVWFYFASNWSLMLMLLYFFFSFLNTLRYFLVQSKYSHPSEILEHPPPSRDLLLSLQWFFNSTSSNSSLVVSSVYWFFLGANSKILVLSRLKHSLNTLIIFLDLFLSAIPVHLIHSSYSILIGTAYAIFNAIYFYRGRYRNSNVYKVFDWYEHPSISAFLSIFIIFLSVPSHLVLFLSYKLRVAIYQKFYLQNGLDEEDDEEEEKKQDDKEEKFHFLNSFSGSQGVDSRQ